MISVLHHFSLYNHFMCAVMFGTAVVVYTYSWSSQYTKSSINLQIDWEHVMLLHRQWQEIEEPGISSEVGNSLLSINGIAEAEQTHETLQRSFRVTGNRICMNLQKHGYTSMDAAGRQRVIMASSSYSIPYCSRPFGILMCDIIVLFVCSSLACPGTSTLCCL